MGFGRLKVENQGEVDKRKQFLDEDSNDETKYQVEQELKIN
jgi:hypothetical protein